MSDKGLPRDIAREHELPQDADVRVVDRTVTDSERIDLADEATSRNATGASADTDPDDDAENSDPLSFLPFEGAAKQMVN